MGLFITIEGIEGAGKSTLRTGLAELYSTKEREVLLTREPGSTELGRHIRSLLLSSSVPKIDPLAELLLFSADRAQHVQEVIRPALERDALVICDRYIHSTLAYQGYGRGLELDKLRQLNELSTGGLMPDLVLLLDLDPALGLERAKERARRSSGTISREALQPENGWSRFEQEELAFHTRIREGFLALAEEAKDSIVVLDASKDSESVIKEATEVVTSRLR